MSERAAARLATAGIFLALVAGVTVVTVMDVSTARRVAAYAVILVAWLVAVCLNYDEPEDKGEQQRDA